jgi:PD-(D/E)XK endonuclease
MRNTNKISALTEGRVLSALVETGFCVSIPFGVARYDLLIDVYDKFNRVQCKTGRLKDGTVQFKCVSVHKTEIGYENRAYCGDADFFGVFCPENEKVYVVPVSDLAVLATLRIEPPKNGQKSGIWWAKSFEIERYYENPDLWNFRYGTLV